MIQNGWLEEPPQIEDRNQLTKNRFLQMGKLAAKRAASPICF